MTDSKRAIAIMSAILDNENKDVVVMLKTDAGEAFQLRMAAPIVAQIAVALFGFGSRLGTADGKGITGQVMNLTGAIPGHGPAGQPVLDLVLEGGMHFPVTFPKSAIQLFQSALAKLQETTTEQPPRARN
jgi:hypothetical protein